MKLQQTLILLVGMICLGGCKKFLSEEPAKQASIQTVAQLEALLDNVTEYMMEENATASYSTDDTDIPKEVYENNTTAFTADKFQYYTFSISGVGNISPDPLWAGEYKKIFTANLVLANIDKVTGDEDIRNRVRADAYFIRAYANWVLANHYCAPYSAENLSSLGLPLKKTIDVEESGKRSTLQETYDFILADILQAQKTVYDDVDPRKTWRVSRKAISAFLSRFYLFTGNYDQSLNEADKALTSTSRVLVDYNTLAEGQSQTYMVNGSPITLHYTELNDWKYTNGSKFLYWTECYYTRYVDNTNQWYFPSQDLMALYDRSSDLRSRFIVPYGGLKFGVSHPKAYRYTMFSDGRYLPEGFTVAEVLLNKAEALARKGNIAGAIDAVNLLRTKRMANGHYTPLSASGTDEAIKKVLEERRREMPFAMRWYDIRRFSVNNYPADDVSVVRNFFSVSSSGVDVNSPKTYTLTAKRYLVPVPQQDIDASKGQLVQNPY